MVVPVFYGIYFTTMNYLGVLVKAFIEKGVPILNAESPTPGSDIFFSFNGHTCLYSHFFSEIYRIK